MGCCYSSDNEDSDQDREERELLLDPGSLLTKTLNGAEPNYHSLPAARTDEQALLSSILAKTSSTLMYWQQIPRAWSSMGPSKTIQYLPSHPEHWKKLPPLPSLTSQPHQVLASDPVPLQICSRSPE